MDSVAQSWKHGPRKNLVGERHGSWVIVAYAGTRRKGETLWTFRCDCGFEYDQRISQIRKAKQKCCQECKKSRPSKAKDPGRYGALRSWTKMKDRCENQNHMHYDRYGGRGIKIEWKTFDEFYKSMGDRLPGMTIDRIDCDGNYNESNCRWATIKEQNRNKTNGTRHEYNGEVHSVTVWAEKLGIDRYLIYGRLSQGWTFQQAVERPRKR